MNTEFETDIRKLTAPINDQYPRPWMTDLTDPESADVFIVGLNQAKGYSTGNLSHDRHIDALFNRGGENCRAMYVEMTGGNSSRTRKNIGDFVSILAKHGVTKILETNVICYSTPMSADLRLKHHMGGTEKGSDIFNYLVTSIRPHVVIVHGAGASDKLCKVFGIQKSDWLQRPKECGDIPAIRINNSVVLAIPALAPPEYNKWMSWGVEEHLSVVANKASNHLLTGG